MVFQEVAQRSGNWSAILEVVQACSYGACLFGASPAEVTVLGLLQWRLLPLGLLLQEVSGSVRPAPAEVSGSGLLLQRSLSFFTAYCSLLSLLMIYFEKLEEEKGRCI